MGTTKISELTAPQSRLKIVTALPTVPYLYYGSAINDVDSVAWKGGEMCYLSGDNRFYIQNSSSGTSPEWRRLLEQTASV